MTNFQKLILIIVALLMLHISLSVLASSKKSSSNKSDQSSMAKDFKKKYGKWIDSVASPGVKNMKLDSGSQAKLLDKSKHKYELTNSTTVFLIPKSDEKMRTLRLKMRGVKKMNYVANSPLKEDFEKEMKKQKWPDEDTSNDSVSFVIGSAGGTLSVEKNSSSSSSCSIEIE